MRRRDQDRIAEARAIIEGFSNLLDGLSQFWSEIKAARQVQEVPDCYKILGVLPDAPISVVRAAYRARMKEKHPDLPGGEEAAATLLNWAYEEILKERGIKK